MVKALFVLSLIFLTACSEPGANSPVKLCGTSAACMPPLVRNAKPGLGVAAIIGDSLAAGQGSTNWNNTPAGCLFNAFKQTTVDHSKPGRTSKDVLEAVQASIDEKPKIIFISSGGNDVISEIYRPGTYPAEQTMKEMGELFQRTLDSGALVVYLGLQPPVKGAERLVSVSEMAHRMGVVVVDGMNGFWGNTDLMSDDIHPNDKGYDILCQRTIAALNGYYP